MNDLEKLMQLTTEEHKNKDKGAAKFFWRVFLIDKAFGVLVVLGIIAALIYLCVSH